MASGKEYWLQKRHTLEVEPKLFKLILDELILEADFGAPPRYASGPAPGASGPVPETNMEVNSQVAQPPSPTDDTVNN